MPENPPVFARPYSERKYDDGDIACYDEQEGITLRDHFAGLALAAILPLALGEHVSNIALRAYCLADAMLAQREKENKDA